MKRKSFATIGTLIGTCLIVSAEETPQRPMGPGGPPPREVIERFDKDKDGQLSDAEREDMRAARQAMMEQARKAMLEKFDEDKDGKLSEKERETMREARKAEVLKKFDTDGDGELSAEEKAAMPKLPGRPHGPPGKRGPGMPPVE